MKVQHIAAEALADLVRHEIRRASSAGTCWIRDASAFERHLVAVAQRAEDIALRLAGRLPAGEAPDPVAAFVSGAWHDGGKIWHGDDYHEITGAVELLERGIEWGLVRGATPDARVVLRRAALAIVPHFAIYEQWNTAYVPTRADRHRVAPLFRRLAVAAARRQPPEARSRVPSLLLPSSIDALVVMYSDMLDTGEPDGERSFEELFERRWREIEERAALVDPAIVPILPAARPRVYAGCALVDRFLACGFDKPALERFRASLASSTGPPARPGNHSSHRG